MIAGLQDVNDLWSHVVPGIFIVGAAVGLVAFAAVRTWAAVAACVLLVAAHVGADLVTSRHALWPGGPEAGLDLYAHPLVDFAAEVAVGVAGWLLYRHTLPAARRSSWPVRLLLGLIVALQAAFSFMRGLIV